VKVKAVERKLGTNGIKEGGFFLNCRECEFLVDQGKLRKEKG